MATDLISSETLVLEMPTWDLVGKQAFVTGGARGIGRALALALAAVIGTGALLPVALPLWAESRSGRHAGPATAPGGRELAPDEALRKLLDGNRRFVGSDSVHPNQSIQWCRAVAEEQHPFAVVLGCSDSRVPPEVIFDGGLGDLFVVRAAGHIADDAAVGSIQYAVEHLGVPLVVVLGHKNCGAVRATVHAVTRRIEPRGHIARLVEDIKPAVEMHRGRSGDLVEHAVRGNVQRVVRQLLTSNPVLNESVRRGRIRIVGAYYDLHTGQVELL